MINRMVLYIYLVVVICLSCNYQITDATPIMKKGFCESCGPEEFCFFQVACVPRNIENYSLQETMKLLEGLNNIIRNKDLIWKLTFFPCLFLLSLLLMIKILRILLITHATSTKLFYLASFWVPILLGLTPKGFLAPLDPNFRKKHLAKHFLLQTWCRKRFKMYEEDAFWNVENRKCYNLYANSKYMVSRSFSPFEELLAFSSKTKSIPVE